MWSSFTQAEKQLFLWLLGILTAGTVLLQGKSWWQSDAGFVRSPEASAARQTAPDTREAGAAAPQPAAGQDWGVASDGFIDINRASADVLETLPGIGPAKARAIIETREALGGFRSVEDLLKVKGLGEVTVGRLRDKVTVSGVPGTVVALAPSASLQLPQPVVRAAPPAGPMRAAPPALPAARGPVNINTASAAELEVLDGIGPVLAQRIVEDRQRQGAFRSTRDLERVKGIGPKILARNLHRITVR